MCPRFVPVTDTEKPRCEQGAESMAKHRDDAMRRYQAEMAQFRDEQLAEISKLTLDGFDEGEDTEDEDLGDWTDIARRAREHAGLPPDPDERLGPAHGA